VCAPSAAAIAERPCWLGVAGTWFGFGFGFGLEVRVKVKVRFRVRG